MESSENTPDEIVRLFCDAWSEGKLDKIMEFFAEDAIYHNIPMEPAAGKDDIRLVIEGFLSMTSSIEFKIIHQVASKEIVMNERIDTLAIGDNPVRLPVAGIFEIGNGLITKWRDYFDMAQFTGA